MNEEQIQNKIDSLTRELKDCTDDSRYARLWDERVELKENLNNL